MENNKTSTESVREIFIDLIDDPRDAMRTEIDREGLWDLAEDIKKNGLINPITVRPVGERFEVVAGHRRLTACKMASMIRVSAIIREVDDEAAFGIMASENLVREDVDPVDEAEFILKIQNKTGKAGAELASMIRRSHQYVLDRLEVAQMPDYLKAHLKSGRIKLGAALALNQILDDAKRRLWVEIAARDGVSVRQAEYWLYQWKKDALPASAISADDAGLAPSAEYKPPMMRCAVDGKDYHMADVQVVMVFKGNLKYIDSLRAEIQNVSGENLPPQTSE